MRELDYGHRIEEEKKRVEVTFDMTVPVPLGIPRVIATIEAVPGVRRVQEARGH